MDWRRVAIGSTAALALLLVAGAIAFKVLVDPQRLVAMARERALATWQRDLQVGEATLRLWPVPSLHAARVAFANPPWARQRNLIEAGSLRADFELLPLLTGRLRIRNLTLEDVVAGLEEGTDGAVSWQLHPEAPGSSPASSTGEADLLHIGELRLKNVRVQHRERERDSAPVVIREAVVRSGLGLRDVRIESEVQRHGQPLRVRARFDDLSRLGEPGATSRGQIELAWPQARLEATGMFALQRALAGQDVSLRLEAESIQRMLAFFGFERGRTERLEARGRLREAGGNLEVRGLQASLGTVILAGDGTVERAAGRPRVVMRLEAGRIDWLKTLEAAGGTVRPPRDDGRIFHPDPVAWRALGLLGAVDGAFDLRIEALRMGNGLELRNVRATARTGEGRVALSPLAAELLGGSASGSLRFHAPKRAIEARLEGRELLLEQWFRQRGSRVPFSGGPMRLDAKLAFSGATYRELAASTTGSLAIRMGEGHLRSKKAGEVEELMVRALAPRETGEIRFECATAALDFRNGRAEGRRLLGARSDTSQLLTAGSVDLRAERLDLRGALRARDGASLGIATLAGDVQISGPLTKPRIRLDEDGKPAIIARAAAAIATSGVTLLGGAIAEAADRSDPCEAPRG